MVPFYVVFNCYKQSRIVPLDAIASESHSSSGRFIPLPPLFIAIAHCHPPFPNLDFCSIYQISSPSHNSILSYSVFSSVLNLSHSQSTFFFFFFFFEKTIVIVSKSGGPMQQQVSILSFISSRKTVSWTVSF